jgi:hypothetical protein
MNGVFVICRSNKLIVRIGVRKEIFPDQKRERDTWSRKTIRAAQWLERRC